VAPGEGGSTRKILGPEKSKLTHPQQRIMLRAYAEQPGDQSGWHGVGWGKNHKGETKKVGGPWDQVYFGFCSETRNHWRFW
jgi:hypothetical protein